MESYLQSLAIAREINHRCGEANALYRMGVLLEKLGDRVKVIEHLEVALKLFQQIEDPNAEKVRELLRRLRG